MNQEDYIVTILMYMDNITKTEAASDISEHEEDLGLNNEEAYV